MILAFVSGLHQSKIALAYASWLGIKLKSIWQLLERAIKSNIRAISSAGRLLSRELPRTPIIIVYLEASTLLCRAVLAFRISSSVRYILGKSIEIISPIRA